MSDEKIPRPDDEQVDDLPADAVTGEEADKVAGGGIEPTPFMPTNPSLINPKNPPGVSSVNNTFNR